MTTQDVFKGKNKTYKNDIVKFHSGGIESKNYYSFIPFNSITRIYLGELPPTITLKTLAGIGVTIVGLFILLTGKWWGILLGLIVVIIGCFVIKDSWKKLYALNIDMASSAIYSFIASKKEYINKGYELLLETINKKEDKRQIIIYNYDNGVVQVMEDSPGGIQKVEKQKEEKYE